MTSPGFRFLICKWQRLVGSIKSDGAYKAWAQIRTSVSLPAWARGRWEMSAWHVLCLGSRSMLSRAACVPSVTPQCLNLSGSSWVGHFVSPGPCVLLLDGLQSGPVLKVQVLRRHSGTLRIPRPSLQTSQTRTRAALTGFEGCSLQPPGRKTEKGPPATRSARDCGVSQDGGLAALKLRTSWADWAELGTPRQGSHSVS